MNVVTIMLILSSIIFIIACFYLNHILKFKVFSFIFIKGSIFIYLLYVSSKFLVIFLHETGHAISALLYSVPVSAVNIVSFYLGFTVIGGSSSSMNMSIIAISGGLGIVVILVLFLIGLLVSRKELKGEIFIRVHFVYCSN